MNIFVYKMDATRKEETDTFSFNVDMSSHIQHSLFVGASGVSKIELGYQGTCLCHV